MNVEGFSIVTVEQAEYLLQVLANLGLLSHIWPVISKFKYATPWNDFNTRKSFWFKKCEQSWANQVLLQNSCSSKMTCLLFQELELELTNKFTCSQSSSIQSLLLHFNSIFIFWNRARRCTREKTLRKDHSLSLRNTLSIIGELQTPKISGFTMASIGQGHGHGCGECCVRWDWSFHWPGRQSRTPEAAAC